MTGRGVGAGVCVVVVATAALLVLRWIFSTQPSCTLPDERIGGGLRQMCFPPDAVSTAIGNWGAGVGITAVWLVAAVLALNYLLHRAEQTTTNDEGGAA